MLWTKYRAGIKQELLKKCREFCNKLENAGVSCDIIKEHEIVRLYNLINNPAYTHLEE